MASYLSNLIKATTAPFTTINTSLVNQARFVVNSTRSFAVAASKKKIAGAKARPALTSAKKPTAKKPAAKKAAAKKAEKLKADIKAKKEKELKAKEKEKAKAKAKAKEQAEKEKLEAQKEKEKSKAKLQAEKDQKLKLKEKEKAKKEKAKELAQEKKEKAKAKLALVKADKEKKPKRLPTAYSLFYKEQFTAEKPKKVIEFARSLGKRWQELDEAAKQQYKDKILQLRPAYEEARNKYLAEKKASTKLNPYNKYIQLNYAKVQVANPNKKLGEISKIMSKQWRELSPAEKQRLAKQ